MTKPKILVVDDEHVIADTLAIILNRAGYDAKSAYDGRQAVEKAHSWCPDVLICDVIMPDMNGIEAAICIRGSLPDAKFSCFPAKPPRLICWNMLVSVGMTFTSRQARPSAGICWIG